MIAEVSLVQLSLNDVLVKSVTVSVLPLAGNVKAVLVAASPSTLAFVPTTLIVYSVDATKSEGVVPLPVLQANSTSAPAPV